MAKSKLLANTSFEPVQDRKDNYVESTCEERNTYWQEPKSPERLIAEETRSSPQRKVSIADAVIPQRPNSPASPQRQRAKETIILVSIHTR